MERSIATWIAMQPEAVMAGSDAMKLYCIKDARHDILELYCAVDALKESLRWCVENDGECLSDHSKRLEAFQSLV
jgi:hypothetical protein